MENKVITVDVVTGEVVERELTEEEVAHLDSVNQQVIEEQLALEQKTSLAQSAREKLAKLGLTDDEINAIIGGTV